ncbi:hypothetical protein JAAARDRAFT_43944 [Jaapia argillacea MUCL 33604]|uniref:Uncharacterized protein n=1 Tax=Jaapia argillacea MUCL 33604 TaxID=933084 RepID=A0A067QNS4_9AGAM|nr:hypothetical protein JAAARDRAFT_43944 [Jaapia argillacea MUCL 33604]
MGELGQMVVGVRKSSVVEYGGGRRWFAEYKNMLIFTSVVCACGTAATPSDGGAEFVNPAAEMGASLRILTPEDDMLPTSPDFKLKSHKVFVVGLFATGNYNQLTFDTRSVCVSEWRLWLLSYSFTPSADVEDSFIVNWEIHHGVLSSDIEYPTMQLEVLAFNRHILFQHLSDDDDSVAGPICTLLFPTGSMRAIGTLVPLNKLVEHPLSPNDLDTTAWFPKGCRSTHVVRVPGTMVALPASLTIFASLDLVSSLVNGCIAMTCDRFWIGNLLVVKHTDNRRIATLTDIKPSERCWIEVIVSLWIDDTPGYQA